jgi:SAM-dependent methyltransferase
MIDPVWNELLANGWGKYPNESLVRFLCRYKRTHPFPIKVLDGGCGGGANTKMMLAEGFDVYAIDGAPNGVELTRAFTGLDEEHLKLCDFNEIATKFEPNTFDIVVDNVSFGTTTKENLSNILSQTKVILKTGGILWSCTFLAETTEGVVQGDHCHMTQEEVTELYGTHFKLNRIETHRYTDEGRVVSLIEIIGTKDGTQSL